MSAIDWVLAATDTVKAGDLVSAGAGGMPIYRVVAVEGGQAWLQGDRDPAIQMMPLHRFHWKAARVRRG
jgi:hypothetical protein